MSEQAAGGGCELTLLDGVRWRGVALPGARGHALLAALTQAAPRTLGVDDLVDRIWGDTAPDHPEKALQVLVSRTRARTAPEAIVHGPNGYRLGLREDQVDVLRLARLLASAREAKAAGDLDVARYAAREALAVPVTTPGHDGPLGELAEDAERRRAEAERLLGAVLLARGDHAEALPLLEAALARDPDDEERLAEVLRAEALVRGVPAALARYAAYVEQVRDTLGAEPGDALKRLHAELLARDAPVREGLKYDAAPMVGRDQDVTRIRGLLESSRVVSVIGAGGLGKTRMAHLVGRLAQQPVVHFVELAGVNAPEGVLTEVASALGVREANARRRPGQLSVDLRARTAQQLAGAPTLLILDNCEHVIEAVAALVAYLVATTDETRVLTTSRAPLGIAAEQVYLLPQLDDAESAELFGQRARSARSGVRLDPEEVSALVSRLDGLPLAVELAAAKVRVMAVAEISRRLGDRFALLVGGDRSAPDRHQTLEAVIDWSWNLLREEDRATLRALAVFPDGFSLAGAEAVLGHDPLAAIAELVDQSLLVVREGRTIRYRFLETVREYGLRQLALAGEEEWARVRFREWASRTGRDLAGRLFTPDQVAAMHDVREELGNLSGAMHTAIEAADTDALVPLVATLSGCWTIEGDHLTVLELTQPVLDLLGEDDRQPEPERLDELRGVLSALMINAVIFTGRVPEQAVRRLRSLDAVHTGTRADATCRVMLEVYAEGIPDLPALEALCADPDPGVARLALQWASQVRENAGEVASAIRAGQDALALCDDLDGPWTRALVEAQLSGLASQAGDFEACIGYAERALPVMEELGAIEDSVQLRSVMALANLSAGRLEEAENQLGQIVGDERSEQTIGWSVAGHSGRAELALAQGRVEEGLAFYRESIQVSRQRLVAGLTMDIALAPWVIFAESGALAAHALYDGRQAAEDIAVELTSVLPRLLDDEAGNVDFPVVGGILVGLGLWHLCGPEPPVRAVRLIGLGHRFGYHRVLPSMAWSRLLEVCERVAPGDLASVVASYAERPPADLREEALRIVRGL